MVVLGGGWVVSIKSSGNIPQSNSSARSRRPINTPPPLPVACQRRRTLPGREQAFAPSLGPPPPLFPLCPAIGAFSFDDEWAPGASTFTLEQKVEGGGSRPLNRG